MAEVAVTAERYFSEHKVAEVVQSVGICNLSWVDDIAFGFTHLLAVACPPSVCGDVFWQFHPEAHKESRPVDGMETEDIFAYEVYTRRPEVHICLIGTVTQCRDVVHQRIEPDIHDMFWVVDLFGEFDTPVETGTGNGEVFKSPFDKADDLVALAARQDALRMGVVPCQQLVLIGREAEEVALLFYNGGRLAALRTELAVHKLDLGEEGLTGDAVVSFVDIFVDVTVVEHDLKGFLYPFHVVFVGRTDELVVADAKIVPEVLEGCRDLIGILLRAFASGFGGLFYLLSVFVRTGQKEGLKTAHA